jgi:hypothetical protein
MMMWEMASGHLPWEGMSEAAILAAVGLGLDHELAAARASAPSTYLSARPPTYLPTSFSPSLPPCLPACLSAGSGSPTP